MRDYIYNFIKSKEIREYFKELNLLDDNLFAFKVITESFSSINKKLQVLGKLKYYSKNNEEKDIINNYTEAVKLSLEELYNNKDLILSLSSAKYDIINNTIHEDFRSPEYYYSFKDIQKLYDDADPDNCIYWIEVLYPQSEDKKFTSPDILTFELSYFNGKLEIFNIYFDQWLEYKFNKEIDYSIDKRYPLPFKNEEDVVLFNRFINKPIYGKLNSEMDQMNCWYHFLDDKDGNTIKDLSYNIFYRFPGCVFDSLYSKEYFINNIPRL